MISIKRRHFGKIKCLLVIIAVMANCISSYSYDIRVLNAVYPSASIEQKCMLIDRQGLIWLGTNSGIKSYDGYRFNTYRSDAQSPNILPNNQILSMTEDNNNCLWIGTKNGLVCMDKKLGSFTTYHLKGDNQREIYTLFTTKDGNVWIGTDDGITIVNTTTRSFHLLSGKNVTMVETNGKRHPLGSINVKSFVEDKDGSIYIGTWNDGYYRFDRKRHLMYKFAINNNSGSKTGAFHMILDPKGRLWISTWGDGIKVATNPRNQKNPGIISLYSGKKETSINYKLLYDPMTNSVWTCSRFGVGIADCNDISRGFTYYNSIGNFEKYNIENTTDICTDRRGNIWVQCINNGLYHINTKASLFSLLPVIPDNSLSDRVKSIYSADGNNFWLSLAPCGIATYSRLTGRTMLNSEIPALANIPYDVLNTHFSSIACCSNGELWMASNGHGIIAVKDGKAELRNSSNCKYVKDNFVKALVCTRKGVTFIGERHHLSYLLPSGQSHTICGDVDVVGISEDHRGNIWVATENKGIIRISGNLANPRSLKYTYFCPQNGNFSVNDAIYCKEDSRHRMWAISNSGGLFLFENGKFNNFNDEMHWDIERIFSIVEDNLHRLWLTTDNALVCLTYNGKGKAQYATYTNENGLGKVNFMPSSCLKWGDNIYFGSGKNLITFNTRYINGKEMSPVKNIIVTDLIIDDKRYSELDSLMRRKLGKYTPQYLKKITIPASVNKFSVEFALLSYVNTSECKYAYKLEAYDKD